MNTTPDLRDVLAAFLGGERNDINVAMPGRVESYDAATQRASVQPLIQAARVDEDGDRISETLPVVHEVPVVFPGCGAYSITFPIAKGDGVLLVFSQGALDRWLDRGGIVDPEDDRRHSINDAIAIPGLRAAPVGGAGMDGTAMVLQAERVDLGESGTNPTDELVHGTGIDPFTGSTYKALGSTTSRVRAKKT